MIVCSKCGKENQDHYKFCLGCGSELAAAPSPRPAAAAPRKTARPPAGVEAAGGDLSSAAMSPTPAKGVPALVEQPIKQLDKESSSHARAGTSGGAAVAVAARASGALSPEDMAMRTTAPEVGPSPASGGTDCPTCGQPNPKEFVFCGSCGTRLQASSAPRTVQLGTKPKPSEARAVGKLGLIRPDGSEGGVHLLRERECIIGRGSGPLFDHDSYLSPSHARISFDGGTVYIEDIGSLNGVFVRIIADEQLRGGDIFRIGQELLRFDAILEPQLLEDGTEIMGSPNPGYWGRLSVIMGPGLDGSAFPLMGEEMVLGRERGDILFSDDGYVSGTHAKLLLREDGYFLVDLGSSNGSFIRLTQPREIKNGTFVLMGQQLFRFEQL